MHERRGGGGGDSYFEEPYAHIYSLAETWECSEYHINIRSNRKAPLYKISFSPLWINMSMGLFIHCLIIRNKKSYYYTKTLLKTIA